MLMKKKQSRRVVVIVLSLFIIIMAIGLTGAAVYARRYIGQGAEAFMSQIADVAAEPATQEDDRTIDGSIYDMGVLVVHVSPNGPAAAAGIRRGTIILSLDGQQINTPRELSELLALRGDGATVSLSILNGADPEDINVTLAGEPPLLGVQLAECAPVGDFGGVPGMDKPFARPEQFPFSLDNLPFDPGDFGFDMAEFQSGVLVAEIVEGSAAALAGVAAGDVIESINSEPVKTVEQFIEQVGAMVPGENVVLTIRRRGETQELSLVLGAHPDNAERGFIGVHLAPLMDSRSGKGTFGIPFGGELPTGGAVIVEVVEDSPAALAGLQAGDLIETADDTAVETVDQLINIVGDKRPGDTITLSVSRSGQTKIIEATLSEHKDDASRAYLGVQLGAFFNIEIDRFGNGHNGVPHEEYFFPLQPNFVPGDLSGLPWNLEEFLPNLNSGQGAPSKLQEQDA
jgi:S1-C subfamily serine protease